MNSRKRVSNTKNNQNERNKTAKTLALLDKSLPVRPTTGKHYF